jgi:hypothetical protein
MVGAEGTRAGKNFHTVASSRFNLARRGKEMEGRARAQLQPCGGRSGGGGEGGSGQCMADDRRRGGGPPDGKRVGAKEVASGQ